MEQSSPLAAIHRPRFGQQPWARKDPFVSLPRAGGGGGMGLREQLQRNSEYLSLNDVRGSSPAASLAADLSQNFRLDNESSPCFATPRRNLFSAAAMMGAESRGYIATPEVPDSSPLAIEDMMQDSPLPVAPVAAQYTDVEIMSPTPAYDNENRNNDHGVEDYDVNDTSMDADDSMMADSPAPVSRKSSFEVPKFTAADRRAPRRPSLSRMKGYTTTVVHGRGTFAENQLPSFRFGESKLNHANSSGCLGGMYENQPPQERRPPSAGGVAPFRYRPQVSGLNPGNVSKHGSPAGLHSRRPSNPFFRSRKQFRRSLSMFEHPEDVMRSKTEPAAAASNALQAVMDIEEPQEPSLPNFSAGDPGDTIPRISSDTLVDVLDGKYGGCFDEKMIIDCRFEYEYDGGHIDGAINYNDKELLAKQLFDTPMRGRTLIVLHCEYSAHRAPLMARHIRSHDRNVNAVNYPRLTYPEVYILSGGYSEFFDAHRYRCYPQNYVEMSDENHQRTCERELGRLKARKQPTLGRAKTFAFGANNDGSPFARRGFENCSVGSPLDDSAVRNRIVTL